VQGRCLYSCIYGCILRRADSHNSDTFTGAYSSEYLRQKDAGQWDIRQAVIRANKAAALTIMQLGAQRGIPWSDEIDNFDAPFNEEEPDLADLAIN
jgi:ribokinase